MINRKLALFFAVLFALGVLVVGTTVIVQDGNRRIAERDEVLVQKLTILGPYGEASTCGQVVTKVPTDLLEQWLSACRDRIVVVCPMMDNAGGRAYISGYLVVTEKKDGPQANR